MAVFYAPETDTAKEMRKWEYGNPAEGYRGYREVVCTVYPKMLYKAMQTDTGVEVNDRVIVNDEHEERNMVSRGFRVAQIDAIAAVGAENREIARLAAERHYQERSMSDAAKREIAVHEDETDRHLAVIPVTPIKKRGRPAKKQEAAHGDSDQ